MVKGNSNKRHKEQQERARNKKEEPQKSLTPRSKTKQINTFWGYVFKLVGFILSMVAVLQAVDFLSTGTPQITAENTNPAEPFETRFLVRNRSWLPITNVEFRCTPSPLIANNGHYSIDGIVMIGLNDKVSEIKSGQVKQFKCRAELREIMSVNEAHILVSVSYSQFYRSWKTTPNEFTWFPNADPPRWIEGEPIN